VADVAVIRKQVRSAIERARSTASARRARAAEADTAWETFLTDVAVPAVRQLANVLRAEGQPFDVQTPLGAVHLVSERSREDRIELERDTTTDPPSPLLIARRGRGGHVLRTERPLAAGVAIAALTEDEVVAQLLDALTPWLE
jgi:hypothetical protein